MEAIKINVLYGSSVIVDKTKIVLFSDDKTIFVFYIMDTSLSWMIEEKEYKRLQAIMGAW